MLRRLGLAISLVIVSISLFIFVRTIIRVDPRQLQAAFAATGGDQIALAFALSALSYLALTGYDGLALRHLRIKVPYKLTALASFTSYAISFTLGFPLITGAAVRYWIYGPAGLSAGKVASLTAIASITFWLGMGLIVGVGFLGEARGDRRPQSFQRAGESIDRSRRDRRRSSPISSGWALRRWRARPVDLQSRAAGAAADPGTDGARRHRRVLRRRRALRAAAQRPRARLPDLLPRSIRSPPCSASPATRRAASACSKRRC